jgi:uncharacterized protein with LGFP repeats
VPCPGGPEYASRLRFAVVHHTVNSNNYSAAQVPGMMRSIQAYHMNTLGYCDIAYNFIIDRFGGIWEARDGGITRPVIGGHSGGFNTASVGIALLGTYSTDSVPLAEYNSLLHLLRWRLSVASLDPSLGFTTTVASSPCNCMHWAPGTVVSFPNAIVAHRDLDSTECPGDKAYALLDGLRTQVQAGLVFPPPTTVPTTVPPSTTTSTT